MNITELDQYNLADAVKFHNRLNPHLWGSDEQLLPEVRSKLLEIAADFQEFLGLSDLDVEDITLSGSNAAYSYTPHSDIDLHLVVNVPKDEVYQELFNAKKYQYNDIHNIRIRGADVELYVQPADEAPISLGEYSIKHNKWIEVPKRKRAKIDQSLVRHKYEDLRARIESALKEDDSERVQTLIDKIKAMRQAGLDKHGEFGPENLAFKMLRKQGWIKRLYEHSAATKDKELSLKEQPKRPITYGFRTSDDYRSMFKSPETQAPKQGEPDIQFKNPQDYEWYKKQQAKKKQLAAEGHQGQPYSSEDGVSPTTTMVVSEDSDDQTIVQQFIQDTAKELGIEQMPKIYFHLDDDWGVANHSFGKYEPDTHELHVNFAGRHIMDILRTTAHELAHCRQHEISPMPDEAGDTGSPWENEAHAVAGIVMRNWADRHPEMFDVESLEESASGYIPTKKQAKDPRYSMALTVDIKPGQVGKEANKMMLDTDSQGKPAMIYKSANQLDESLFQELSQEFALLENEFISEIKMSPTNLRQEAAKTGAKAGMEFEMIVPGVGNVDDSDQEPDMDQNQRVRYFGQIRDFFHDGDYNGRREVDRLEQELIDAYLDSDFLSEIKSEEWSSVAHEAVTDLVERDYEDDLRSQAEDEVMKQTPEFGTNSEELDNAIDERFRELFNEKVDDIMANMGREYDEAYEEWDENDWQNRIMDWQDEWLEHEGIETMWDVHTNYDISWPYWTSAEDGEVNVNDVAEDFSNAIDRPINASTSYHGAKRAPGHYVVEPDGSLDPDDSNDTGLEFVSPPLPIDELISDLNKVKAWADGRGCYTNSSTGLHINISVPNYSLEKLDYIKLALLMGDKYVLQQFDRAYNTYTKSAMDKIRDKIKAQPERTKEFLDKMRNGGAELASKIIHSGTTDKYTSINTKDGYIEFRSPGGDWLDANFDKIENTLLRFTVALSAAINPEAYREEYLKKLYKLLDPAGGESRGTSGTGSSETIKYFADYVAGKTPKAALRSFIKQAQLERKLKRGEVDPNAKFWWRVYKEGKNAPNGAEIELVATTKQEAQDLAAAEWGWAANPRRHTWDAEPVRPYTKPAAGSELERIERAAGVGQQTGTHTYRVFNTTNNQTIGTFQAGPRGDASNPPARAFAQLLAQTGNDERYADFEVIGQERTPSSTAMTLGGRPSNPDGNWVIIGNRRPVYRFMAANRDDAETVWLQWSREHAGNWELEQVSQPEAGPNNLTPQGPGPWELYRLSSNTPYRGLVNRDPAQAEREARASLGLRGEDPADFGIRTRQEQPAAPTGAGREFAGWKVLLPSGEEVYRFSGVGNSQADANRIAAEWLRNNGMGVSGEGFEVVPVWNVAEAMTRRGFLGTMGAAAAAGAAASAGAAVPGFRTTPAPTTQQPQPQQQPSGLGLKAPNEFNLLGNNPQNEITLQKAALGSGLRGPELAQFLGQMKHESWNFERLKEQPKGQNYFERRYGVQHAPKTASILGNKYPGDGERYHGRGYVQLTGRENYRRAGEALGLDLLNQPDLAARPDIAAKIAMWYWNSRVKPRVKNFADTAAVTKTINPALRGLEDRDANFKDYMRLV